MAMKKAKKSGPIDYPKGASKRSQNASSTRMEKEARKIGRDKFKKKMYDYEYDRGMRDKFTNYVGIGEGGQFSSSGLDRKRDQKRAKDAATKAKTASQQMKQGVTKSGGYAGPYLGDAIGDARRAKRSDKFKAEQAVKKSGGSMTRNSGNKKKNAK